MYERPSDLTSGSSCTNSTRSDLCTFLGFRCARGEQVRERGVMNLLSWLQDRGGVGHRDDASDAGFTVSRVRAAIRSGAVRRIRSKWIALASAPTELVHAASSAGAVTCGSLGRRRGWWVPPDADATTHLRLPVNGALRVEDAHGHWAKPLAPMRPRALEASVEDALADA